MQRDARRSQRDYYAKYKQNLPKQSKVLRFRRKVRRTLLAQRGEAFLHFGPGEAEHLQGERGVESRARHAQPVVERILGPAQRGLRAGGKAACYLERLGLQLGLVAGERDQAQPLGLFAA